MRVPSLGVPAGAAVGGGCARPRGRTTAPGSGARRATRVPPRAGESARGRGDLPPAGRHAAGDRARRRPRRTPRAGGDRRAAGRRSVRARSAAARCTRHATLRAALEWSHGLLTDDEQVLLRRLAVFAGGFTLRAGRAGVCATKPTRAADVLDCLGRLVDKSLVQVERNAAPLPVPATRNDPAARRTSGWSPRGRRAASRRSTARYFGRAGRRSRPGRVHRRGRRAPAAARRGARQPAGRAGLGRCGPIRTRRCSWRSACGGSGWLAVISSRASAWLERALAVASAARGGAVTGAARACDPRRPAGSRGPVRRVGAGRGRRPELVGTR